MSYGKQGPPVPPEVLEKFKDAFETERPRMFARPARVIGRPVENLQAAEARGAFLSLAMVGAAVACGELASAAFEMAALLPPPDYISANWGDPALARTLRRLSRARLHTVNR